MPSIVSALKFDHFKKKKIQCDISPLQHIVQHVRSQHCSLHSVIFVTLMLTQCRYHKTALPRQKGVTDALIQCSYAFLSGIAHSVGYSALANVKLKSSRMLFAF